MNEVAPVFDNSPNQRSSLEEEVESMDEATRQLAHKRKQITKEISRISEQLRCLTLNRDRLCAGNRWLECCFDEPLDYNDILKKENEHIAKLKNEARDLRRELRGIPAQLAALELKRNKALRAAESGRNEGKP